MKTRIILLLSSLSFFYLMGCKDPFEPPVSTESQSLLVVEGHLNGSGPTKTQLSRTVPLNNTTSLKPELDAQVKVEGKDGSSFSLAPEGNGSYTISSMPLSTGVQYRIHIMTSDNKEYVSEYVEYKVTPVISNVSWEKRPNGAQVLVDTRDPQNKTWYYRWMFEETWEFNTVERSFYEWSESKNNVVWRDPPLDLYTCWRTETSKHIALGSSARLQNDIISNYPILFIQDTSWKLNIRYSVLVKQYALTEKAFQYWQMLAKNTEQLGSIFDAQPSELKGNIYSLTDPKEVVIGYISAGTVEEKRIFIDQQDVPGWGQRNTNCLIDTLVMDKVFPNDTLQSQFRSGSSIPLNWVETPKGFAYTYSSRECVDCRERGSNTKPSFW